VGHVEVQAVSLASALLTNLNPTVWVERLIAAGLLVLGAYIGYSTIKHAFTDRAELRTQVAALTQQLKTERILSNANVSQANLTTQIYRNELTLRTQIANDATARADTITKDLTNAQRSIAVWRDKADANLRACLDTPLPDGMWTRPAEAGPAAASSPSH
jgi:hypothetical protein